MFSTVVLVTDTVDEYVLYESIGLIPAEFDRVVVGNTTRSMCRRLCSETYDLTCSGFLYNRHQQNCQLSSYTGEWVTADGRNFHSSEGLEFYRRKRHVGQFLFLYRLMLLGRAAPVVNARLPLTEANVVSENCGRGRGPSHTTPPSYSMYASCGWERSVAERTPAL